MLNHPFLSGGRQNTINDIHYVSQGQQLIPAADTAFAKDVVFGYCNSDLKRWVEEKTQGQISAKSVRSLSLEDIRKDGPDHIAEKMAECKPGSVCVVNAADYRDLEVVTLGLLQARQGGRLFLFRTATSFVRVRAGLTSRPLLTADEMNVTGNTGGLVIVGSHVPRSSQQLGHVLQHGNVRGIELNVNKILSPQARNEEIRRSVEFIENALSQGQDVVVYTSRKLITGRDNEGSLSIGRQISQGLVEIVSSMDVRPRYILAKGGITSSDIATQALGIVRAHILGQILSGVPVWQSGPESKFPDMSYIVFPGNVGSTDAISEVVQGFREPKSR